MRLHFHRWRYYIHGNLAGKKTELRWCTICKARHIYVGDRWTGNYEAPPKSEAKAGG